MKKTKTLQETRDMITLLNDMIYEEEKHTEYSRKAVKKFLASLDERIKTINNIKNTPMVTEDDFSDLFETGSDENS